MFPEPDPRCPATCSRETATSGVSVCLPVLALLVVGLVLVPLSGCSSTGESSGSSGASDHIEFEEIQAIEASDAYQIVQRLRPRWLRSRGVMSINNPTPTTPVVYVDRVRHGQVSALRQIEAGSVLELRYLNAGDATTRFGTGHPGGAILVSIRR